MNLRKITAAFIFPLNGPPIKNGILVVNDNGEVVELIDRVFDHSEIAGLEYYNGILCPGFINAHCHLELSHLKGKLELHTGLPEFLHQILLQRKTPEEDALKAARQADLFMRKKGIVAVGDIANGTTSLVVKENRSLYYHTFIEAFGFSPQRAPRAIEYVGFVSSLYEASRMTFSVTPHAPYSISIELFEKLIEQAIKEDSIISLHHQESEEEDKMFRKKEGGLIEHYRNNLKLDIGFWEATGKSSTLSVLLRIPTELSLLLVHNTYLGNDDMEWLIKHRSTNNTFLVTCPNSNLFIENQLPDYRLWLESGFPICIGTDSLASNFSLSILNEMITIQQHTSVKLNTILEWACLNGAKSLRIDSWAGSFEKGKKPGVNLISGVDLKNLMLTPRSKVERLV